MPGVINTNRHPYYTCIATLVMFVSIFLEQHCDPFRKVTKLYDSYMLLWSGKSDSIVIVGLEMLVFGLSAPLRRGRSSSFPMQLGRTKD